MWHHKLSLPGMQPLMLSFILADIKYHRDMINVKSFSENKLSSNTPLECYNLKAAFLILLNCWFWGVGCGFLSERNLPSRLLKKFDLVCSLFSLWELCWRFQLVICVTGMCKTNGVISLLHGISTSCRRCINQKVQLCCSGIQYWGGRVIAQKARIWLGIGMYAT